MQTDIYNYIIEEQNNYKKKQINVSEGWNWSMYEHLKRSFLYKNSQFERDNENRDKRPFKNIVRPILNIQYRTEGFDVKDIDIYVDNSDLYYKSFITKKYHDKWSLENQIDSFIDEIVESYVDYGGVLVKNVNSVKPEVVDLRTLAFCDQTNLLSGTFVIKHNYNAEELRKMEKYGWGNANKGATIDIETLIRLAENNKKTEQEKNQTPNKYIEIYELHGILPDNFLKGREDTEENKHTLQMHIVGFYKNDKDDKIGITLFSAREPKLPFKFLARDKVQGRALGFGGIEELFESQVWTNFNEIQIREMLELASKTFYKTTDQKFKTRNNLFQADNGQIFDLQQGSDLQQIDTTPRNLVIFENAIQKWEEHARQMGAASEGMLGEAPVSGTPFKLFEAQNIEAKSMHKHRQGKIAVFVDEIYRDWILPKIAKEIMSEQEFLSELSADELLEISERIVDNQVFKMQKEKILNGELIGLEELEFLKIKTKENFLKGNKKFFKILKDEMKNVNLQIRTNVAGKQKNLALLTDKLVNVMKQFIATPQIRQDPEMVKLLNVILESSGMSPIMFGVNKISQQQIPIQNQQKIK